MAHTNNKIPIPVLAREAKDEAVSDVLFFSIGEGAILIDANGVVSRVNRIAQDILGFSEDELLDKWYPSAVVAEDEDGQIISNLDRPITEAFVTGKPVSRRLYLRKKDGGRVAVALNVAPIMVEDRPVGAIELFRDITDEVQLERAKDEFISIASHQLRTPATVVKQNLGMILEGFVMDVKTQMDLLSLAYEHNNNQLQIINNLLNIAQAEAQKLKPDLQKTDLANLLQKVVKSQKPIYAVHDMQLELAGDTKPVIICVDPLHMQMVFENLINNAQKYSPPNTKVRVRITKSSGKVTVSVTDQGVGIDERHMSHLFRKFSRIENIKSTASGTGLGLYWAKKLVELHEGDISVESKLHRGSTFKVTLPLGKS